MSKKADFNELLPLIKDTLSSGGQFPLNVTGQSMEPFLHEHTDTVLISASSHPLRKGELVFIIAERGRPILHRVSRICKDEFYLVGDNQIIPSGPYKYESIVGVVYEFKRNGKKMKANTLGIRFSVALNRIKLRAGRFVKTKFNRTNTP